MAWQWKENSWNDFADRAWNTMYGCSGNCSYCWARNRAWPRIKHLFPGQDFNRPFDVPRKWEVFRAKPHERIAWNFMGDMFDPAHSDDVIEREIVKAWGAYTTTGCTFIIQTRHVNRAWKLLCRPVQSDHSYAGCAHWAMFGAGPYRGRRLEIGTSFTGSQDLENVRALAKLSEGVVRFIAFEPFPASPSDCLAPSEWRDLIAAVKLANPQWCYIGPRTPYKAEPGLLMQKPLTYYAYTTFCELAEDVGCKVIMKPSCGPELYERNEGVELP